MLVSSDCELSVAKGMHTRTTPSLYRYGKSQLSEDEATLAVDGQYIGIGQTPKEAKSRH